MATDPKSRGSVATFVGSTARQPGPDHCQGQPPDQEAGEQDMSALPVPRPTRTLLPCHADDPDLWFAEAPADLERQVALRGLPGPPPVSDGRAGTGRALGCVGRRDPRAGFGRESQTSARAAP